MKWFLQYSNYEGFVLPSHLTEESLVIPWALFPSCFNIREAYMSHKSNLVGYAT